MVGCREIRQRIAAKNRRFARIDDQPQNHELTGLEESKTLLVGRHKNEGSYTLAFLVNSGDSHRSKAGPGCRWLLGGKSRIPHRGFRSQVLLKHCPKRALPTLAKRRNQQGALQLLAGRSRQIKKGVNVGHTHSLWTVSDYYDFIAGSNFAFLQHAEVKTRSVVSDKQRWHTRFIHADADAVAGYTRLTYFKNRVTNAVAIADADFTIEKSLDGEVFSELAESKITAVQKPLPVMV